MLGKDVLEVVQAIFKQGELGRSMKEGIITLLFKKGEKSDLQNWRPITLLNADYKLVAKVLTGRLGRAMPHIVHIDQTCGVPGRSAQWNLQLIRDVIGWAEDRRLPLVLVSLDQQKAFDRVHHGFLFKVLQNFGFGEHFLRWFGIMYNGVFSRLRVNGNLGREV